MNVHQLNLLPIEQRNNELFRCCGAVTWVEKMAAIFPVPEEDTLFREATKIWQEDCAEADWLEAFSRHPRIGDRPETQKKFASTAEWAAREQHAVGQSSEEVLETLSRWNSNYEEKFGYIFIVCATGRTAEEMLAILSVRLTNNPEEEIIVAMNEQLKITIIRLQKLLTA
ncbi:MAG: 2-oxo-4-hydroxy-4-carboxy-5-ureidoimidazoline decarboxylase [Chitinophagaceae bacterium]